LSVASADPQVLDPAVPSAVRGPPAEQSGGRDWLLAALLTIGYGAYNLDKSVISILIEPLKHEFGLSDTTVGLLTGIGSTLPIAIFCIPLGMLADRQRRLTLIYVLLFGWSLMTGVGGLATGVAMLFISRAGVGAFESAYTPISMSLLADSFPLRRRATAMGTFSFGGAIGTTLGLALGGIVADGSGWRMAFYMAGIPGVLLVLVMMVTLREPKRGRFDGAGATDAASFGEAAAMVRNVPGLAAVATGMTLGAVGLSVLAIWTPSLLMRVEGVPLREAGLLSALVYGIGGGIGPMLGGWLADRVGRRDGVRSLWVPVYSLLFAAVAGLFALLLAPKGVIAIVALTMASMAQPLYLGIGYATVATLAGPRARGTIMSMLLVAINVLSFGFGLYLVGKLSDLLQPIVGTSAIAWGYSSAFVIGLLAAYAFWRGIVQIRSAHAL